MANTLNICQPWVDAQIESSCEPLRILGNGDSLIRPARYWCRGFCLQWDEFQASRLIVGNTHSIGVERVAASFQKILRGS